VTLTVTPLTAAIGAEVTGLDLRAELDDATLSAVRAALLEHLVLFFRDQPLEPDEQLRFALRFGPVSVPAFLTTATAVPEVMVLDQVNPKGDGADRWHVDNTYMPCPPMGSILRAVELPALGGDTLFASMYEAYDALSPALRSFLDGLCAEHDITKMLANSVERGLVDVDIGAVRAESRDRPQAAVRQWELDDADRRSHRRRERRAAPVPARARAVARVPVPVPLDARRRRILGQPRRAALRGARLPLAPCHAPHHDRRRRPRRPLSPFLRPQVARARLWGRKKASRR
jgi:hypothetical protein